MRCRRRQGSKVGYFWGTTSILAVCQRPPKCHHFVNATFRWRRRDGLTTFTKRPFADLYNVWNWSVNWDLPINPTKCNYIAIGRAPQLQLFLANGSLGDSIQVANAVKDLGILVENSFSPSIHCKEFAPKARRMLFMIRRSFAELPVPAFAPLYNTLVRPHLEYALQACSPNLVVDADCLEQIQRLATSLVKGCRRLPHEERLWRLGCTPYIGVVSVQTSQPYTKCFLEE